MSQLQCPNCGGFKINQTTNHIRKVPGTPGQKIATVLSTQVAITLIYFFWKHQSNITPIILLAGVIVLDVIISAWIVLFMKWNKIVGYGYYCELCGNRWDWFIGTPWPQITIQPGLIRDAQVLQQEEEARKQQEDLEALHYLTHLKK